MNIGIIGSGNIGANAAKLFARAGHAVAVSNSRGPESLQDLVDEIGPNARAATVEEAADFGEVVLVAIPFFARDTLPAGELDGKVVVDATNYYPGRDGEIAFGDLTSSELLRQNTPGARLVKAFNTMYYETLANEGRPEDEDRLVLFVAGDDEEAKTTVSGLIGEIGFAPVDAGPLRDGGRKQQPDSPVYNEPMTADEARETLAALD
ncbi:MAG: NAD(P)-binding domain-containing protein [Rubrobacteraceae bacterium]